MKRKNAIGFSKTNWNSIIKLNAINTKRSDGGLMIPTKQAKSMVSMIPDSFFNDSSDYIKNGVFDKDAYADNHRIIDVCCNSGVLLEICYNKFMMELSLANTSYFESNADVEDYVLQELLFAFVLDIRLCKMLRERFYHSKDCVGNIFNYNIITGRGSNASLITILDNSIAFGDKVLKFDVVCGNPPYNNDMYLDFVMLGHRLSKTYGLWITPDGWRTKDRGKNPNFRETLFDNIVCLNFDSSLNIFPDIAEITIDCYLIDKSKHKDKLLNKVMFKDVEPMQSFDTKICNIVNKVKSYSNFKSIIDNPRFKPQRFLRVTIADFQHLTSYDIDNSSIYTLSDSKQSVKINSSALKPTAKPECYSLCSGAWINPSILCSIKEPYNLETGTSITLLLGTENECKSAKTYYESSFVWFLVYGVFGKNVQHTRYYKFVPDPGSFDKVYEDKPLDGYTPDENGIYTDSNGVVHCSLYVKYKLSSEEISVIESVIKNR